MVFVVASVTQFITLILMWFSIPNYPRKNTGLTYLQILRSMIHLLMTEPLLVQACLIGYTSCTIFVSWWTTLTFLLTASPYQYDTLHIGLFGLCGIVVILSASTAGRINDWLLPYVGTLLGLTLQLVVAVVALSGASVSLGAVIFVCICTYFFFRGKNRRSDRNSQSGKGKFSTEKKKTSSSKTNFPILFFFRRVL